MDLVVFLHFSRRSEAVLTKTLPEKDEYVIPIRMTSIQTSLYKAFVSSVKNYLGFINPIRAFSMSIKVRLIDLWSRSWMFLRMVYVVFWLNLRAIDVNLNLNRSSVFNVNLYYHIGADRSSINLDNYDLKCLSFTAWNVV